ncbi:MAG: restriction endonuclease subunit S [Selenomonadales bacterium]|nr:restriction endonuclease subunit S [Selenomonadales bacterium]
MREMKGSGIPWIGKVPSNWLVEPIFSDFVEVTRKNKFGREKKALKFTYGEIVPKANFDADNDNYVADTILKYTIVEPGTIMLNGLNLNYDFISQRIGLVKQKGVITSAYTAFKPINMQKISSKYSTYLFKAYDNCKAFHNMGGGVRKILNFKELSKQPFIHPPIGEQHRIADYLDTKCARIDSIRKNVEAEIEALKQYKQSVITEAVTKGLDKNVEMKDSGIPWIGEIPKNWEIMPNKYLMHKVKKICPVYNGENILSLTIQGVIIRDFDLGGKMPATFDGYQIIYPGNLLMCLFDYDVTPRCIGLIKDKGLTSPAYSQFVMNQGADARYYYYYYLLLDFTKELLHLAKNLRHSFTEEQLGKIKVPVPPIEEQHCISDYLDTKCAKIDSIIQKKQELLANLDTYKKSLIYEYVTGKKEVPAV